MLLSLAAALALLCPAQAAFLYPERSTAPIVVVWPPENFNMPPADNEFIFGSVSDPKGLFQINGLTVVPYANGAFLAWLPIQRGTFTFDLSLAVAGTTATFQRTIFVPSAPAAPPEGPAAIDTDSLAPRLDLELRSGDWLTLRMRASAGQKARYRLGKRPWQDLKESAPGVYEANVEVAQGEQLEPTAVEYALGKGWSPLKAFSRSKVSFSSGLPAVAVAKSSTTLRAGPGNGYFAFPLAGTKLVTAGRMGGETKIRLSPDLFGWVKTADLDLLPPGTPAPRAVTGAINTASSGDGALVRISLTDRVAFVVDESDDRRALTLRLYNTVGHTNWIVYDSPDSLIEEVRWKQEASDVVAVTIRLKDATVWGWQASYEGASLKLEVRKAPDLADAPASALKGRTVILDPGHMPSATGSTGPMGTTEMSANYAIARAVEALLLKEGAYPVLTRNTTDQEVSLVERPRIAVEKKGDVFVSLHNNALPDGENPFARPRVFYVFYYHPHSLSLARALYRSYQKNVPLPGEDLRYGDLLVARLSAMPAVLIESAYMIMPEQEEKLNDASFRRTLAETVVSGLKDYFEDERLRQRPTGRKNK